MFRIFLAGDIGGTKTRLALCRPTAKSFTLIRQQRFASRDYPNLSALIKAFLGNQRPSIGAACLGVAGPVMNARCEGINLPWVVEASRVKAALRCRVVALINDLEATAYGIGCLPRSAFASLQKGHPQPQAPIAVLAPGTGLGEATLIWDGKRYVAVASEGGHADFAPRNELEVKLWRALAKQFGHVSYERMLSGPGKLDLYYFLRRLKKSREPAWLAKAFREKDPSLVVSEMALNKRSALCVEALGLFASILGAEAGNLALKVLARGGVYLGGGIPPSILSLLKRGSFMEAFLDKGRLSSVLTDVPVRVILDDRAALFGAAYYSRHRL